MVGELRLMRHENDTLQGTLALETFELIGHCPQAITVQAAESLVDDDGLQRSRPTAGKAPNCQGDGDGHSKSLASREECHTNWLTCCLPNAQIEGPCGIR